nr:FTR1 family iron permease [Gammaproteobacteria bacterium]NIX10542.1 cytochrome C [Gammaproteobacteria bacterium]
GLYSAISLGVEGTAMSPFSQLNSEQRWALAFYTGSLAFGEAQRDSGQAAWSRDQAAGLVDDLASLVDMTPADAAARQGQAGLEVLAYLRAHPEALAEGRPAPLHVAREHLNASLGHYHAGNSKAAYGAALSAYLEGFEMAESGLRAVAPELVEQIEHQMLAYRKAVRQEGVVSEVERRHGELSRLLGEAARVLDDTSLTPAAGFVGAFAILLREGLEAILILAAVGAVLVRTGRRDALPWLHAGWIAALAMGAATWALSSYLIEISGAGRELTEGFTALLAAAVLLYVGFWLHGKTHSDRWQQFIRERIQHALHGRGLWLLALIAFLAVYREVFETVLFYQALWLQAGPQTSGALWGGIGAAAAGLAVLTWIIVRSSLHLPLHWFFGVNAAIMLVLAVAFAGHGIAGLQEAGWLPADPVQFPRLSLLGIYPTVETLSAQLVLVALVAGVLMFERRRRPAE